MFIHFVLAFTWFCLPFYQFILILEMPLSIEKVDEINVYDLFLFLFVIFE